ncbi:hypothetical protein PLESTF_001329500 [Pleodorina starrii]|nr:hypothetical protein PLESTF_001329500 [Pleodorina starrii]
MSQKSKIDILMLRDPGAPCTACAYLILKQSAALFPIVISEPQCKSIAAQIAADIAAYAAAVSASMLNASAAAPTAVTCDPFQVKVCVSFRSGADGARLQPWIQAQAQTWLGLITGSSGTCPPYLEGHTLAALVGGDGGAPPELLPQPSCLAANITSVCEPAVVNFPKCKPLHARTPPRCTASPPQPSRRLQRIAPAPRPAGSPGRRCGPTTTSGAAWWLWGCSPPTRRP